MASIAGAFASACLVLQHVLENGGATWHYMMGGWIPPIGIEFALDPLNSILAVLVTFISMLVSLYSRPFVKDEDWLHVGGYYTLFGLLTVGLSGMIITGDVFNLYVYLEIMSLSGYALIALGGRKSMLAAFRYLLIGTIGASLYLLGVGYLYAMTGTLNMADLAQLIIRICIRRSLPCSRLLFDRLRHQDGTFPAAWLAAGCLHLRTSGRSRFHRRPHEQGTGVCTHSFYLLHFSGR